MCWTNSEEYTFIVLLGLIVGSAGRKVIDADADAGAVAVAKVADDDKYTEPEPCPNLDMVSFFFPTLSCFFLSVLSIGM
jgi:hypothetical protein